MLILFYRNLIKFQIIWLLKKWECIFFGRGVNWWHLSSLIQIFVLLLQNVILILENSINIWTKKVGGTSKVTNLHLYFLKWGNTFPKAETFTETIKQWGTRELQMFVKWAPEQLLTMCTVVLVHELWSTHTAKHKRTNNPNLQVCYIPHETHNQIQLEHHNTPKN